MTDDQQPYDRDADLRPVRDRLLEAALPHVAFDGWTDALMDQAARDAGVDAATLYRAFPRGVPEVLDHFCDWLDRAMVAELAEYDLAAMRLSERVRLAVLTRLTVATPWREAVRRAMAHLARPSNGPLALKCIHRTVDEIWFQAGDTAADFSWYTKRATLAWVYVTTLMAWLDDGTDDLSETAAFLDRRLADIMQIPKIRGRAERIVGRFPDPLALLRALRQGRRPRFPGCGRGRPGGASDSPAA